MKKTYKQHDIVIAKLESKKIAAIKASDSGPLIIINKEHKQSSKVCISPERMKTARAIRRNLPQDA